MSQQEMSYKEAFGILKANADKLRKEEDIDIDELVPIVEASSKAYGVVKARIDAAKKALAAHMPEAGEKVNESNDEDSIPF